MMPEMDGVETAGIIRKIDRYADTPVIALTANDLRGMRDLYIEKGFQDYLSKPISPEALDEIIKKQLTGTAAGEPETGSPAGRRGVTPAEADGAEQPGHGLPAPYSLEIESRRLDKLNHYRAAFEMSTPLSADAEYFARFAAFVASLDVPDCLRDAKTLLAEAGQDGDARAIRGALPAFCENMAAEHKKKISNEKTTNVSFILQSLKEALRAGDGGAAGKIVTGLGGLNLDAGERELYFKLYDLLMEDNAETALETIERYKVV